MIPTLDFQFALLEVITVVPIYYVFHANGNWIVISSFLQHAVHESVVVKWKGNPVLFCGDVIRGSLNLLLCSLKT